MKAKEKVKENELKLEFVFDLINVFSIVQSPEDTAFFIQTSQKPWTLGPRMKRSSEQTC